MSTNALDLINRKQAEIERLQNECFCLSNERDAYKDVLDTAIAEAIKEFAEVLKTRSREHSETNARIVYELQIDNLVQEMAGDPQ